MSEVRAFFDRWQRLEKAKAEISDDLKELFAEAKATGFNTKAMRVAFRAKVKAENETDDDRELAAIVDLYLAEIDEPRARPASARVENIEEFDAETGEIKDEPEAAAEVAGDYLREPVAAEQGQIIREGDAPREASASATGEVLTGKDAHPDTEFQAKASEDNGATGTADAEVPSDCMAGEVSRVDAGRTASATSERMDVTAGETAPHSNPQEPTSSRQADSPASTSSPEPGTHSEDFHPGTLWLAKPKTAADYRPRCLHPEACGSSGLHHCYSCEKALERESEAA